MVFMTTSKPIRFKDLCKLKLDRYTDYATIYLMKNLFGSKEAHRNCILSF
jgi:hypothetical protein